MSATQAVISGTLKLDGSLELDQKPDLPPGRVQVTVSVAVASPAGTGEDFRSFLRRIQEQRAASGIKPRTREEIDADINAMRDEDEMRMREIEHIQEEAWQARNLYAC